MPYLTKSTDTLRQPDTRADARADARASARVDSLGESLIRQDSFICDEIYDPDVGFADLYTNRVIEISMVVAGSGVHRVFNQAIPCKVGDIYILNTNVPHRYFASEDGERLTVRRLLFDPKDWFDKDISQATGSRFCFGVFSENSVAAYAVLTQRVMERIESLCDEVAMELLERKSEWREAVRANLSLILITLGRYLNRAIKNIPRVDSSAWNPVSAAMTLVMENYSDHSMTLESIAESFYISQSHLSRLFKQVTGESFSDYLKKVRLAGACTLLVETDLTVEEVMKRCGMRDAPTFYRAFGEYSGMTPNKYRKANRKGETNMSILIEISENLQKGKAKIVKELVQKALDEGVAPDAILNEGLLAGMNIVGEKFKTNEVYVPEVLVAARAMNMGTQILKPHLIAAGVQATGKVCIGTVQGDLHDIGKNLVKMMMEGKGLEVVDLGTDVSPETFVQTAIDQNCQIICCSALLTTTMGVMEEVVKKATEAGIRDKVKIMIGGAPVNEAYCEKIGADVYTPDAASAADAAAAFCKG